MVASLLSSGLLLGQGDASAAGACCLVSLLPERSWPDFWVFKLLQTAMTATLRAAGQCLVCRSALASHSFSTQQVAAELMTAAATMPAQADRHAAEQLHVSTSSANLLLRHQRRRAQRSACEG
jgi:hypothetical protein